MKKLFYDSAYIRTFEAKVLSCEKGKKGYEVALDQTAFYPEGGLNTPAKAADLYEYFLEKGMSKDLAEGIMFRNAEEFFRKNL